MTGPKTSIRTFMKDAVGYVFMALVVVAFVFLLLMKMLAPFLLSARHDNSLGDLIADSRCICVCPHNLNTTNKLNSTVFVSGVNDPGECTCESILAQLDESKQDDLCLRCECNYESRNAALIAMIVYGMLIITFGCMPPCAVVVCLYPFITRRRSLAAVNHSHRPQRYSPLNEDSPLSSPTRRSNTTSVRTERLRLLELPSS